MSRETREFREGRRRRRRRRQIVSCRGLESLKPRPFHPTHR
jgi:hypothetical protein